MIVIDVINLSSSADTLLRERVLALRRRGIDNHIVCMAGAHVFGLQKLGIPVHVVDLPRGIDPRRLVLALAQLMRLFRSLRPDIVHTHCSVPGAVGRIAARLVGVPVVVHTVHGFHFDDDLPWFLRGPSRLAEWALGLVTHTLLTQNRSDLAIAEQHGIGPRHRRRHIGNGIDLDRFQPVLSRPASTTPPVVICVARFEPVKNHAFLLDVVARVVHAGAPLRLWLVGTGELERDLWKRCDELGITGTVEFLGYREDIPELLAQSDIAVLTSRKEGMPRGVLEAMAVGLPVVGTRVPGTREAIRSGYTGFTVELGDVDGFSEALGLLLRDSALRTAMGARGREVALAQFDERSIIDSLEDIYQSLGPAVTPAREPSIPERSHERLASPSRTGR